MPEMLISETPISEVKQPISVLLVDDVRVTVMGIKAILEKTEDIKVTGQAENGEEAIDMVERLKPDVILMDVAMPVMDGIRATAEIVHKTPNSKIIMLTGINAGDKDVLTAFAAGASAYFKKDLEPETLYSGIRSVHAGYSYLDPAVARQALKYYQSKETSSVGKAGKSNDTIT